MDVFARAGAEDFLEVSRAELLAKMTHAQVAGSS
jgi:hypothetical protein